MNILLELLGITNRPRALDRADLPPLHPQTLPHRAITRWLNEAAKSLRFLKSPKEGSLFPFIPSLNITLGWDPLAMQVIATDGDDVTYHTITGTSLIDLDASIEIIKIDIETTNPGADVEFFETDSLRSHRAELATKNPGLTPRNTQLYLGNIPPRDRAF